MGSGGHSLMNVTYHLKGLAFPAARAALLERARNGGAGQDALETLECLPDKEFGSLADVLRDCEELDQDPQTGIIDIRP